MPRFNILTVSSLLLGFTAAQEYADIVGFSPLTDVRDQLRIDLDQQKIVELLEAHSEEGFAAAKRMYELGAFSKSVSELTVSAGLPVDIVKGTKMSADGVEVYALDDYTNGTTVIRVQYVNEGCYVGANPEPVTEGCLPETGTLEVEGENTVRLEYEYDVSTTSNNYSIQLFTRSTEFTFDGTTFTSDFQKFVDYYGSDSYADDIIQAALAGTSTNFPTGKDLDMSNYDFEARAAIASKASAYMAVWIYVIRELEHAIYLCQTGSCEEDSCLGKAPVHEVDEAVAFYAGSLEGPSGSSQGVLTYRLAQTLAPYFGTEVDGQSVVNADLLEAFQSMSDSIVGADCDAGRTHTTRIVQLMSIPLIQGTLRSAHITGFDSEASKTDEAEGAVFAAAVLPLVAACNADNAETIYTNMKTGQANSASYDAVKAAFENNYDCLGVTSEDIGENSEDIGENTDDNGENTEDNGENTERPTSGSLLVSASMGVVAMFGAFFL